MKRVKKSLRLAALVVGAIFAVGLIGNAIWIYVTSAELEQKLAALRAEGQPSSIPDLAPKPIPPEGNATTYLRQAQHQAQAVDSGMYDHYDDDDPLERKNADAIAAIYNAFPGLIPLLEQAAECPDYESQLDYTVPTLTFMSDLLNPTTLNRTYGRVLTYHSTLLRSQGKHELALHDTLTLLRLVRHFDNEPTLVNFLVSCAVRGSAVGQANLVLQTGTVSPASREALERELARFDGTSQLKYALRTERATGLSMHRDTLPWSHHWLTSALLNREMSFYLDFMSREIAETDKPYWKYSKAVVPVSHALTSGLTPAMLASHSANARMLATIRCLRVLNALQALPENEQVGEPKLSDLKLPPDATIDPFTGNPLHATKLPTGWLVYSVGENRKDDGGNLKNALDVGLAPPTAKKAESENSE